MVKVLSNFPTLYTYKNVYCVILGTGHCVGYFCTFVYYTFIRLKILWGCCHFYLYYTVEETEAHRCIWPQNKSQKTEDLKERHCGSRMYDLIDPLHCVQRIVWNHCCWNKPNQPNIHSTKKHHWSSWAYIKVDCQKEPR